MFKRRINFTARTMPPKFKTVGMLLYVLDPEFNRWMLVGKQFSKKHVSHWKVMLRKNVYRYGYIEVYVTH